jgi:hypothetical protein
MEDLLKHAFDTTLVGLFAILCYGGAVLACVPPAWHAVKDLGSDKLFARAGLVLLPVAYVVGSISFAMGDGLFNAPPRWAVAVTAPVTARFGLRIESDQVTRAAVYTDQARAVCHSHIPDGSPALAAAHAELCVRGRGDPFAPSLAPRLPVADTRIKPLYTYQKYRLLSDTEAGPELRTLREHLVILRGAATHGYALAWLSVRGAIVAAVLALAGLMRAAVFAIPTWAPVAQRLSAAVANAQRATGRLRSVLARSHGASHSFHTRDQKVVR